MDSRASLSRRPPTPHLQPPGKRKGRSLAPSEAQLKREESHHHEKAAQRHKPPAGGRSTLTVSCALFPPCPSRAPPGSRRPRLPRGIRPHPAQLPPPQAGFARWRRFRERPSQARRQAHKQRKESARTREIGRSPHPCSNPNERARRRRPLLRQQSDQHGSLAKDEPISPAQRSPATPRSLARNELLQRPAPGLSHETPGALSAAMVVLLPTLGPVAARLVFYPTLLYTLVRERLPGLQRPWFSRIDHAVILGALPLRGRCRQLVEDENVRGVLTMNEEYETRFLCWSPEEWEAMGVEQLRLSTVDLTGVPSLENLHKGVKFVLKHRDCGNSVYVHCKAGRFRSATMVAAYLIQLHQWTPQEAIEAIVKIRPHIIIRQKQVQLLEDFHRSLSVAVPVEAQHNLPARQQKPQETQQEQKPLEAKQDATLKTPGS